MSKKEIKPLDKVKMEIDVLGNMITFAEYCPTCLQEVKKSWTSCQYCEQPFTDK